MIKFGGTNVAPLCLPSLCVLSWEQQLTRTVWACCINCTSKLNFPSVLQINYSVDENVALKVLMRLLAENPHLNTTWHMIPYLEAQVFIAYLKLVSSYYANYGVNLLQHTITSWISLLGVLLYTNLRRFTVLWRNDPPGCAWGKQICWYWLVVFANYLCVECVNEPYPQMMSQI